KYEQGEYKVAADTLKQYLLTYRGHYWSTAARYLLALSLAHQGQTAEGAQLLSAAAGESGVPRNWLYLARKWRESGN
ncbi:MAG: tol-pal system YbgF family protein, partial [Maioricimonas sp. JB045]